MAPVPRDSAAAIERFVARYRETGDPQAFGALFDATAGTLFRVALSLVRDPARAEDVLQQTFLVAIRKLGRLPVDRPAMPWLTNVLTKEAAKSNRRRRRRPDPARRAVPIPLGADEAVAGKESEEAARRAVEALEEPYRSVALLRWRYGLEPAEIAHVRGEPPGTTRSLLSRALERLRGSMLACPAFLAGDAIGLRGLDHVRRVVVREAALAAKAAAATAGVAAVAGGILVKKTVLAACVVAALAGGYLAVRPTSEPVPRREEPSSARPLGRAALSGVAKEPGLEDAAVERGIRARPPAGPPVRGVVTSTDGRPIRDAWVCLHPQDRGEMLEWDSENPDPSISTGSTGEDGRFEIESPLVERASLLVMADGYSAARVRRVLPGEERTIVLRPSGAIRGRVMDAKGRAIPDADVALYVLLGPMHTERHATSATDGSYRIDDVPDSAGGSGPRASRLVVDARGYARQVLTPREVIGRDVPSGGEAEINVVLSRGARVEGRVLETPGGNPVPGARVILWTWDGLLNMGGEEHPANAFLLGEAVTGADGAYSFTGVPAKGFHADLSNRSAATGRPIGSWLAATKPGLTTVVHEVELAEDGATLLVDLRVRPAFSVEGRVVDGRGRPVAGVRVTANVLREGVFTGLPKPFQKAFPTENDVSASDGTYRLDGVAVPREGEPPFGLYAKTRRSLLGSQNRAWAFQRVEGPYEGTLRAPDLVFDDPVYPWGRVRVTRADGEPVRGAEVGFSSNHFDERTDADGRARVALKWIPPEHGKPGPAHFHVHAPGFSVARVLVTLADQADEEPPEALVVLKDGHRLTGRVTTRGGPLPEETVVLVGNGNLPLEAVFPEAAGRSFRADHDPNEWYVYREVQPEPDGSFAVDDLPEGPYHVMAKARAPDAGLHALRANEKVVAAAARVPSGANVSLALPIDPAPPSRTVHVRVVDAQSGEPVLKPWGELIGPAGRVHGRRTEPGLLRFEKVLAGTWQFSGSAEGYVLTTLPGVEVTEEPRGEPVVVRVARGVRVRGTVKGPDDVPYVGQILLEPYDSHVGKHLASAKSGGWFEAEGVPPGRYRISGLAPAAARSKWFSSPEITLVEVRAGADGVRIDERWIEAGQLVVMTRDARFLAPVGRFLTEEQARLASTCVLTVSDSSGRAVARRDGFGTSDTSVGWAGILPPGSYVVRFVVPEERPIEHRVDVAAREQVEIVLGSR